MCKEYPVGGITQVTSDTVVVLVVTAEQPREANDKDHHRHTVEQSHHRVQQGVTGLPEGALQEEGRYRHRQGQHGHGE